MIIADRRTPDQVTTHNWLVVATDTFLSGRGAPGSKYSYAAWACDTLEAAERVADRVRKRCDSSRVRIVHEGGYRPRCAHFQVYVIDEGHRYASAA
jgi:hypothetical protein